jgi:hypothetical protein
MLYYSSGDAFYNINIRIIKQQTSGAHCIIKMNRIAYLHFNSITTQTV